MGLIRCLEVHPAGIFPANVLALLQSVGFLCYIVYYFSILENLRFWMINIVTGTLSQNNTYPCRIYSALKQTMGLFLRPVLETIKYITLAHDENFGGSLITFSFDSASLTSYHNPFLPSQQAQWVLLGSAILWIFFTLLAITSYHIWNVLEKSVICSTLV